ncbi:MAG TPA: hypothetical protein VFY13_00980 [Luteolibacter sp.]|nr:hypothetical protein [Luteolibacter sp.]
MAIPVRLLLVAIAACSLSACAWVRSWRHAEEPAQPQDAVAQQTDAQVPTVIDSGAPTLPDGSAQAVLVRPKPKLGDRLRLPDMENLPNENDLHSGKPAGDGTSGVIVRPPSQE